ncbi:MAG: PhzF family phenazine biosynthesis protein [candidate division NC10 bacterium]|nr:PhzF family phenazine biosynthesis protein [candidate division NC10 bacterium]
MRYRFYTADVFTDRVFGGNPLAVFPEARGLPPDQMREVAREFNLSETVFVFPAEQAGHTRRLRIFTPGAELPFAGHPTIGTAHVLASIGEITLEGDVTNVVFEEGVGPVPVSIHAEDNRPVSAKLTGAKLPEFGPPVPPLEAIASVLSLDASDLLGGKTEPQAVSCGVPFLFVPVRDRNALRRVQVNQALWKRTISSFWAPHLYVFTYDPEVSDSDLRARMFAPGMGIEEDPATGSAATALAGYLGVREEILDGTLRWKVEQGFEMGRPSILHVEADKKKDQIVSVRVGGASVLVSEGTMEIPNLA